MSTAVPVPAADASTSAMSAAVVSAQGWVSVWSTPWGKVRVDGRIVGDSPAARIPLPPGPHLVTVKNEAGEQSRTVTIRPGEESRVRFVF
ncbi:MAG: PEGA domain-containing protein [Polyangiaceae bacterium]